MVRSRPGTQLRECWTIDVLPAVLLLLMIVAAAYKRRAVALRRRLGLAAGFHEQPHCDGDWRCEYPSSHHHR